MTMHASVRMNCRTLYITMLKTIECTIDQKFSMCMRGYGLCVNSTHHEARDNNFLKPWYGQKAEILTS